MILPPAKADVVVRLRPDVLQIVSSVQRKVVALFILFSTTGH